MITVTIPIVLIYAIAIIGVISFLAGLVSKKKFQKILFAIFFSALIIGGLLLTLPTVQIK